MNPLTAKPHLFETAIQNVCLHHGNSLVYAFAEVSIEQTMKQDIFNNLYANFCPHKTTNRFVLNRCVCRFESVWLMPISQKHITQKRITLSQSSSFLGNQSKFTS